MYGKFIEVLNMLTLNYKCRNKLNSAKGKVVFECFVQFGAHIVSILDGFVVQCLVRRRLSKAGDLVPEILQSYMCAQNRHNTSHL